MRRTISTHEDALAYVSELFDGEPEYRRPSNLEQALSWVGAILDSQPPDRKQIFLRGVAVACERSLENEDLINRLMARHFLVQAGLESS